MKTTLADGEDVLISGFGTLLVRQRNARRGRAQQTKEALMLKARKVLALKTSRVLREKINWSQVILLHPCETPCEKMDPKSAKGWKICQNVERLT